LKSTWIADPAVEQVLHSIFEEVDSQFSLYFGANSLSNEERLTGVLAEILVEKSKRINEILSAWGRTLTTGPWYVRLYYKDVSVHRGEKKWGSDLAIVLDVKFPGRNEFRKAILLQAKKMQSRQDSEGVIFGNYWRIDIPQAVKMLDVTASSFHILYNPDHAGLKIRILPTASLISLAKATQSTTVLHTTEVAPSTRRFADFMLYDFIGCWAGDFSKRVLRIAEGSDEELLPNHIIRVVITNGPGVLD
jgi:hypothetical protein